LYNTLMQMQLIDVSDREAWDQYVAEHAWGHPLQLWGWGEAKRGNNWTPHRLALVDGGRWVAAAQVLLWPIPRMGRFIAYVPRGPVVAPGSREARALLDGVVAWAKAHKALYVRLEPAWTSGQLGKGWVQARHHLQMDATYTIDLRKDEAALQEPMSHKHRQYIRKSERDGVSVLRVENGDLAPMYRIYAQTAVRAGFGIHGEGYYDALHRGLGEWSYLYYAWYQSKPVAFLWLAGAGRTAYELYGGVDEAGQAMKANYALKWRAMLDMKAAGYEIYDFNGRLNEGVTRFKEGFGPDETNYIGTWDYPIGRAGYQVWEHLWPAVKVVGRRVAGLGRGRWRGWF
jgi:peptidoglycan pentaglycine glycine transferase (the first glycine)